MATIVGVSRSSARRCGEPVDVQRAVVAAGIEVSQATMRTAAGAAA